MRIRKKLYWFLMPQAFSVAINMGMVPILTLRLGPADFGVYSLFQALITIAVTAATLGSGFQLAAHFEHINHEHRRTLVSTILFLGFFVALLSIIIIFLFQEQLQSIANQEFAVTKLDWALALASIAISYPWIIATEVLVLEGRAKAFALIAISQILIVAVSQTIALLIFDLGRSTLFMGSFVGGIVSFIGTIAVLKPYIGFRVEPKWVHDLVTLGSVNTISILLENVSSFVERIVLGKNLGLSELGIYRHAQQYQTLLQAALKAFLRSLWPLTLQEAREVPRLFRNTRRALLLIHFGLTAGGILSLFLGEICINFITHHRFGASANYLTAFVALLLIRNIGRPQEAVFYAYAKGVQTSFILIGSLVAGMAFIVLFVPIWGSFGAIFSLILQQLIYRVGIQIYLRISNIQSPFEDGIAFLGVFIILTGLWWKMN